MILIKTLWGVPEMRHRENWNRIFAQIKADGFDGVECWVNGPFAVFGTNPDDKLYFRELLMKYSMRLIVQIHTCSYPVRSAKLDDHIREFEQLARDADSWNSEHRAVMLINSHSGKDSFTHEEALKFFAAAAEIEASLPNRTPIAHETHRQRILYNPFVYRSLMAQLPSSIKVTADLSHFCVGCERVFDDDLDADFWPQVLADIAKRVVLIHARVGWAQGPQVCDPDAPEYADAVAAHFRWWGTLASGMKSRGVELIAEPEHGPGGTDNTFPGDGKPSPGYAPCVPYTQQPLSNLWHVNAQLGKKLRAAFG